MIKFEKHKIAMNYNCKAGHPLYCLIHQPPNHVHVYVYGRNLEMKSRNRTKRSTLDAIHLFFLGGGWIFIVLLFSMSVFGSNIIKLWLGYYESATKNAAHFKFMNFLMSKINIFQNQISSKKWLVFVGKYSG